VCYDAQYIMITSLTKNVAHDRANKAFVDTFGAAPAAILRAPGRVNLIGEHTDYNDGFVLPCAIDRDTFVAIGPAHNGRITAVAADFDGEIDSFEMGSAIEHSPKIWANYVRGIAKHLNMAGCPLVPVNMAIAGDVPLGSGLSSSASLEIAVGLALAQQAGFSLDPNTLAQIAQASENQFVGCACGIMDQLISARGIDGHALLIDCRSLECTPIIMPAGVSIIIAHSGVHHSNVDGEYNDRRNQCEAAARHYNVKALRDLDLITLEAENAGLDDVIYRRARHVVTENDRTLQAGIALQNGDLKMIGRLMQESHMSMRDDFGITIAHTDRLADIMARALNGQGGARQTGGGFGGCVIAIAQDGDVTKVIDAIAMQYRTPDNMPADVFVCKASAGAG
jgi:galactokinase